MKCSCNNKKAKQYKDKLQQNKINKERENYLNSLTQEERDQFLKEEKKRQLKSIRLFNTIMNFPAQLGIRKYY